MEKCINEDKWPVKDPDQFFWRTFNTIKCIVDVDGLSLIEERDDALKLCALGEPQLFLDPQLAADLVIISIPNGSVVRRHAVGALVGDLDPVYLPGHVDMVGVESSGQTD